MAITKIPAYVQGSAGRGSVYAPPPPKKAVVAAVPKKAVPFGQAGANIANERQTTQLPGNLVPLPPLGAMGPTGLGPGQNPVSPPAGNAPRGPVANQNPGNYQASIDEIMNDPAYRTGLANYNQNLAGWATARQQAIQQAVLRAGYDIRGGLAARPDLAEFAGDIPDSVQQAANANPLSNAAQIQTQYRQGLSDQDYTLAARGMLHSGAAATGGSRLLRSAQLQDYNQQNSLQDVIANAVNSFLTNRSTGLQGLQGTLQDVASRLAQRQVGPLDTGESSDNSPEDQANRLALADPVMLQQAGRQAAASNVKQSFANTIPKAVVPKKKPVPTPPRRMLVGRDF